MSEYRIKQDGQYYNVQKKFFYRFKSGYEWKSITYVDSLAKAKLIIEPNYFYPPDYESTKEDK